MNVLIRTATNDDHRAFVCIANEINVSHARALAERFRVVSDAMPVDYFRSLIESDDATVLAADRHSRVVGYAILHVRESPSIPISVPRRYAFMSDLAVAEAEQRQGIGRRLIDAAVGWARAQSASEIELGVFEFNESAISFYEHLGFRTVKRIMSLHIDEGLV